MRWPIEQSFRDGKTHLGMDHYESRLWKAWYRHMLFVFLAQLFLLEVRMDFKKNSHTNSSTSKALGSCHIDSN